MLKTISPVELFPGRELHKYRKKHFLEKLFGSSICEYFGYRLFWAKLL